MDEEKTLTIEDLLKASGQEGADLPHLMALLKNGRITSEPETETYVKQIDPKLHDVMDAQKRPNKMVVTDPNSEDYGQVRNINVNAEGQPDKGVRIEQVGRIALAIQRLIRDRAVSFTFGNPVTYNCTPADKTEADILQAIKRIFYDVKISTVNRRAARNIYGTTEVAEYWYPVEADEHELYGFKTKMKFKVALFSPAYGDRLYPYFDENRDMVAFSREFVRKGADMKSRTFFETYTKDMHYLWSCENAEGGQKTENWEPVEGYPKPLTIGKIPIVYGSQLKVEWEDVQTLIDRLEKLLSNFADTNDYHASPKIFVQGRIIGFARKGEAGGIIEGENGAEAKYLSWANAPESVKLEIETLLKMIYTITQTPDISFDTVKGIGAVSGVALKLLFMDAHLKVQDKCEVFNDYLQRRINILKAYLGEANKDAWKEAAARLIVEPIITPYIIEDEQSKINILTAANGNRQIASRRATVQRLGWADDPDEEIKAIEAEEAKDNSFMEGEPTFSGV